MVPCFAWYNKLAGLISSHDICLMFLTFRFMLCILIILKFYSILRMSHQRHRFVFLLFVFNVLMQPESQGFVQIYCVVSHSFSLRVEHKQNDYFQLCTSLYIYHPGFFFFLILPVAYLKIWQPIPAIFYVLQPLLYRFWWEIVLDLAIRSLSTLSPWCLLMPP